jgi:hypothetical protein
MTAVMFARASPQTARRLPRRPPGVPSHRGACAANPISYLVDGRQRVALAMGQGVFVFALP